MRFGFYINPQTPGPDDDGRIIREVLGQVELAEQLGMTDVWLTEHHFTGYNAYSDPVSLAMAISQRTTAMTIGFSLAVVPFHNPISFVTQCNLLDQLSNGRLIVGMGPGNSPDEYNGFGLDVDARHEMTRDFAAVCEQAWHAPESGFTYSGKFYNGNIRGRIIPAPLQRPRPHIAYATGTPATIEWVGKQGYSLLLGPATVEALAVRMHHFAKGLEAGNHDQAAIDRAWYGTGMNRQIYVARPGEDWRKTIGEYIDIYVRKSAMANTGIDDLPKHDLEERRERLLQSWLMAGTADEIIERLAPFARLGVRHLMVWSTFGHMPDELVRGSLARLMGEVAPAIRDIQPEPGYLEAVYAANPGQSPTPAREAAGIKSS